MQIQHYLYEKLLETLTEASVINSSFKTFLWQFVPILELIKCFITPNFEAFFTQLHVFLFIKEQQSEKDNPLIRAILQRFYREFETIYPYFRNSELENFLLAQLNIGRITLYTFIRWQEI